MHQCGFVGVRVGEASHPGPRVRDKHRRRVASSSDDEPLIRPIVGREVIPRTEAVADLTASGREATVPDSVIDTLEAICLHPCRQPCQLVLECFSSWGCLPLFR